MDNLRWNWKTYDGFLNPFKDRAVFKLTLQFRPEFDFTRREEWTVNTLLYYPLGRGKGAGFAASWTDNNYIRDILVDSTGFYVGLIMDWELSPVTSFAAKVGRLNREYDASKTMGGDVVDSEGWMYSAELLHLLGKNFNHKLSYSRTSGMGGRPMSRFRICWHGTSFFKG